MFIWQDVRFSGENLPSGRDELRGPLGEDVAIDRDAAVIAFFAPIIEECRRTGHSTTVRVGAIESRSSFFHG